MDNQAVIVFPHQLFKNNPAISKDKLIIIVEDQLFFGDYKYYLRFHKKKIILHRASMKAYQQSLEDQGYKTIYIDYQKDRKMSYLFDLLVKLNINVIHLCELVDYALEKRIKRYSNSLEIKVVEYKTPGFITDKKWFTSFFDNKGKYSFTSFYIEQRKKLNILVKNKKPVGGKWTYDRDNRKKIPKNLRIPDLKVPQLNNFIVDALDYVQENFADNPGSIEDFIYPVTSEDAEKWFESFLMDRFSLFGDYEDAILKDNSYLFHSIISPLVNIGLLTPEYVVERAILFGKEYDIPLNSMEGFIRQIVGWREFMRIVYEREGVKQRNTNFWNHKNPLPKNFYTATTGIEPIDKSINRLMDNAYLHHIERLMILGNFMLLCEIDPNQIYNWFMELFIDSYDWVMVPNIYGMSQYADGGLITTKPYISSSNYVLKMSDYKEGKWCNIWNALYWRFIYNNSEVLSNNPRMGIMISQLYKMDQSKLDDHLNIANKFLEKLHNVALV